VILHKTSVTIGAYWQPVVRGPHLVAQRVTACFIRSSKTCAIVEMNATTSYLVGAIKCPF